MSENKSDDKALLERFTAEMQALHARGETIPFGLSSLEAFQLLAALQLVLRHPGVLTSSTGTWLREFAEALEGRLGSGGPAIAEVAGRGWREEFDVVPR